LFPIKSAGRKKESADRDKKNQIRRTIGNYGKITFQLQPLRFLAAAIQRLQAGHCGEVNKPMVDSARNMVV
jgi:hypothetical protein